MFFICSIMRVYVEQDGETITMAVAQGERIAGFILITGIEGTR